MKASLISAKPQHNEALLDRITHRVHIIEANGESYRQVQMDRREAYDYATEVMVENLLTDDAEEGIGAFLEKRAPKWKD